MVTQRGDGQADARPAGAAPGVGDEACARLCALRQASEFREWWRLTLALGIDAETVALLLADHPGPRPAGDGGVTIPLPGRGTGQREQPADWHGLPPLVHRPPDMPPEWVRLVERGCAELFPPAPAGPVDATTSGSANHRDDRRGGVLEDGRRGMGPLDPWARAAGSQSRDLRRREEDDDAVSRVARRAAPGR